MKTLTRLMLFSLLLTVMVAKQVLADERSDSLKSLLRTSSLSDARRLMAYDELLMNMTRGDKTALDSIAQVAVSFARKMKDQQKEASYRISYGMSLYFNGDMDRALEEYLAALRIAEKSRDGTTESRVLHEMGVFYNKNGMRDKSLQSLERSVSISHRMNDTDGLARSLNSLGTIYEYEGDLEKAKACYEESLENYRYLGSNLGMSYSLCNIGLIYGYQKKFELAEKYLFESLQLRLKLDDQNAVAMSYINIAEVYYEKKDYRNAIIYAEKCAAISGKLNYLDLTQYTYQFISGCYSSLGDYKNSLAYSQKHQVLKDSVFNVKKSEQIAEMQTRYETEKKEQQIEIQRLQLTKRTTSVIIIGILLLITLFAWYHFYNKSKLEQEARLQREIIRQQDLSTKAIVEAEENERKRIAGDLHDGIGQLFAAIKMNLSGLSAKLDIPQPELRDLYDKTLDMVDESCREVRSISHAMVPNVLLKMGLSSAIRDFINKIDADRLQVNLEITGLQERIDPNVETVLYRVIQESVTNVIKHAGASRLDIQVMKDELSITATIEDNGDGFDSSDTYLYEGMGLKNIRTRVEYLKGSVEWDSSPGNGTLVSIYIPYP